MPSRDLRKRVAGAFVDQDDESPNAMFGDAVPGQLRRIPLDQIRPREDQPRQTIDPEGLAELTQSIRDRGVLQPIRVRPKDDGYEIVAGERRWTAARAAGLRDVPAVIADANDDDAYIESLIENIQREDLNAVDRVQALKRLRVNLGLHSWEDVGQVIGISRQHVHNLLNITKLPEVIQEDIRVGDLTEKHGRALLRLQAYPDTQTQLWQRIQDEHLSGDAAVEVSKGMHPARPGRRVSSSGNKLEDAVQQVLELVERADAEEVEAARSSLAELRRRLTSVLRRA